MPDLKFDEKIEAGKKRFQELETARKQTSEQIAELNRRMSQIIEEQIRVDSQVAVFMNLKEEVSEPTKTTASPKNEKEKEKKK